MLLSYYKPDFRFIELSTGIKMRYARLGNPGGIPIVLIHGATDSYYSYSQTAAYLADKNYDVYIPELRGHGGTDKPDNEDYHIETHAKDVYEFMQNLELSAHLAGHSLGSFITQELAISYPNVVRSVTLIGTGVKLAGNPTLEWLLNGDDTFPGILNFDAEVPAEFIQDWVSTNNSDVSFAAHIYDHACSLPLYVWTEIFKGAAQYDNSSRLNNIKIPVQIIWGTEDAFFNYNDQIQVINTLENSANINFIKKVGASHNTHWDLDNAMGIANDIISFSSLF